ncbi:hypothetical protein [Longimicrobium sp.]|uniref:hypothetical protein n=1 Tax=Longimicrobium sp. TaxID=2029185 RepID=UPI002C734C26|nr:hypothetical protein [Longimicrobium sp.]HSU16285.1 hypothetical protein [Longimicrobium sp.]
MLVDLDAEEISEVLESIRYAKYNIDNPRSTPPDPLGNHAALFQMRPEKHARLDSAAAKLRAARNTST